MTTASPARAVEQREPWEGFGESYDWFAVRLELRPDGTGSAATLRHLEDTTSEPGKDPAKPDRTARLWHIDRVEIHHRKLELTMTSADGRDRWWIHGKAIRVARGQPPALLLCFDDPADDRCNLVRLHPEVRMSGRLRRLQSALAPP